jgi:RimJ/RimL family protein N-acetyltransferase
MELVMPKQTFEPRPYRLTGRRVTLEPLNAAHIDAVYGILKKDDMAGRWPRRNGVTTRAEFRESIWQTSPLQFAMVKRHSSDVVGLLQALGIDDRNGTVGIGVVIDPDLWLRGWPFEGMVLFIDFLFRRKGYRKAYFEMPASNVRRVGTAMRRWLAQEVTLKQQLWNGQDYEDSFVFSLFAADWNYGVADRWQPTV